MNDPMSDAGLGVFHDTWPVQPKRELDDKLPERERKPVPAGFAIAVLFLFALVLVAMAGVFVIAAHQAAR